MATGNVTAVFSLSIREVRASKLHKISGFSTIPASNCALNATSFLRGSPLLIRTSSAQMVAASKVRPASIRCEQANPDGLDVWLGRIAMIGFAAAITVEVSTGKGLLGNFGVSSPLPTVALAVTGLVGVLTAVFIFQSASKE